MTQSRKPRSRTGTNPYAERLDAAEFAELARDHYGMKTVLFDKEVAEAVLATTRATER